MSTNSNRDIWDIVDILVGKIILVAIPIAISIVGNNISQSLQRGQLVDSLLDDLTTENRQDIALIALDSAIPPPKSEDDYDQVVEIAQLILRGRIAQGTTSDQAQNQNQRKLDSSTASMIIKKRKPNLGGDIVAATTVEGLNELSSDEKLFFLDIDVKANTNTTAQKQTAEIIANVLPSNVRLTYIQYKTDLLIAEELKNHLKNQGAVTPKIEQINSIEQDDIRFSSESDRKNAEELKRNIENFFKTEKNITKDFKLIDLSQAGYQVPSGQFEVWLNQ